MAAYQHGSYRLNLDDYLCRISSREPMKVKGVATRNSLQHKRYQTLIPTAISMHGTTLKDAMSRLSKVFLMYPETAARDAMALIQNHPDYHERVFTEIDLTNAAQNFGWRSATVDDQLGQRKRNGKRFVSNSSLTSPKMRRMTFRGIKSVKTHGPSQGPTAPPPRLGAVAVLPLIT